MAVKEDINATDVRMRYLFHHIFFPPKLPGEDDSCSDADAFMLKSFLAAIQEYQSLQWEEDKHVWDVPIQMLTRYRDIFSNKSKTIGRELATQLGSLEINDTWAFHVRAQNAGIVARRGDRETLFSLFEISATSEAVTATVGRLRRCFPHVSVAIKNDRILDPSFTDELGNMLAMLDSGAPAEVKPKSKKARHKVIETRDTIDPRLVTELLAEMLLALGRPGQVGQFYKHTRDEIHWRDAYQPWRRAPAWTFLRITLQLSLNMQGTLEQGERRYKSVMLFFLASAARQEFEWGACSDSLSTMIAKIERRALKLDLKHDPVWFKKVEQSTGRMQEELKRRWEILEDEPLRDTTESASLPTVAARQLDTRLTLPGLQSYLEQRESTTSASSETPLICDEVMRISNDRDCFPTTSLLQCASDPRQCRLLLLDVEFWVFEHLEPWVAANRDDYNAAVILAEAIHQYGAAAMQHYRGSPEDYSKMLLTIMQIWMSLDSVTIQHLPLLQDYDPEISSDLFHSLLLPTRPEMDRLSKVEEYLNARRNHVKECCACVYPSILRAFAETGCLAERYFDRCRDLQNLRAQIEQRAAVDKKRKMSEYQTKRDRYEMLTARGYASECEYLDEEDEDGYRRPIHTDTCQRCALFSEASDIAIEPLEAPLPASESKIKSVVFELQPPSLHTHETHQGEMRFLKKYQALSGFMRSKDHRVTLASRAKPFAVAHYVLSIPATRCWQLKEAFQELSLHEYYSFCTLRSGHRLQLPNILRELISDSLDFARYEVHLLVVQAVWQAGPHGTQGILRETHSVMQDQRFAEALLQALDSRVQHIADNWKNAVAVLTFSTLAARVLSLNDVATIRTTCLSLLRRTRTIAHRWLRNLQSLLEQEPSTVDNSADNRHCTLLETALVCLLTYDIDRTHFTEVMSSDEDVAVFTECLVVIDECRDTNSASSTGRIRQWLDRSLRLAHSLESTLKGRIADGASGLSQTVQLFWVHLDPSCTWVAGDGSSIVSSVSPDSSDRPAPVHFDLLSGRLLVNGCPLSRLPPLYEQHPLYRRMFGARVIEVYPSTNGSSFNSRREYRGYRLNFTLTVSGHFILRATDDDTAYELVPPTVLNGDLPTALVENYAHWRDLHTGTIEWRPLEEAWTATSTQWRLEPRRGGTWLLVRGAMRLMSMESRSARLVTNLLAPLETASNVHTIFDSSLNEIKVQLPRLGLEFVLRPGDTQLESSQFRDMVVDANQSLGTLTGLRNKLVLIERRSRARVVIIPYEKVNFEPCKDHVRVTIDTQGLQSIKYYAYHVDDVLHRLVGDHSLSSKLYQCYLHALTAHSLPDRLTRRTGTEEALEIIASPSMKSYYALDADQLIMLRCIESCSTQRRYYPSHLQRMQQTDWSSLPSLSQHPAFCTHVQALLDHARSLDVFRKPADNLPNLKRCQPPGLLRKAEIRDSQLRASGYGLERHTLDHDSEYVGRDHTQSPAPHPPVLHTAQLVDVWSTSLQVCPSLLNEIQSWDTPIHSQPRNGWAGLTFDFRWLEWDCQKLGQDWCPLADLVSRTSQTQDKYKLLIALSTICYSGRVSQDVIETLLAFATMPQLRGVTFEIEHPLNLSDGYMAQRGSVIDIIGRWTKPREITPAYQSPRRTDENRQQWDRRRAQEFRTNGRRVRATVADILIEQWRTDQVLHPALSEAEHYINVGEATREVECYFLSCDRNASFQSQVISIQQHLDTLTARTRSSTPPRQPQPTYVRPIRKRTISWADVLATPSPPRLRRQIRLFSRWLQTQALNDHGHAPIESLVQDLEALASCQYERSYMQVLRQSCTQLCSEPGEAQVTSLCDLQRKTPSILRQRTDQATKAYRLLCTSIAAAVNTTALPLCAADVFLRLSNSSIARLLASNEEVDLSKDWRQCLTEYCIILSELQHARRLSAAVDRDSGILQELIDVNHLHWDPNARPDWLLFELENNLMLRNIQIQVSHEIMSPMTGSNSVTQLGMGEGKSSVIVPLASAACADGKTLTRVIVLKPLADQMLSMLTEKLGGLLGRRVFYVPISRSSQLTADDARHVQRMLQECRESSGVWLAQPEHVLSFKLMGIERFMSDVPLTGVNILETNRWLLDNSKDILDESDEILSVRSDLIYAMGEQQDIDFAPERWKIIQKLIELVFKYAAVISEKTPGSVQCSYEDAAGISRVHVMSPEAASSIVDQIVETIIDGGFPGLSQRKLQACSRTDLWLFLREFDSATESRGHLKRLFDDEPTRKRLLLLHSLLAGGILIFVFMRMRWRVDYGLDPSRTPLAVPYRAKDVPSPRSEFSHPDVAILLTCLSHYYGRLTDDQLTLVFQEIQKRDDGADEYAHWSLQFPTLPQSYRVLAGVNLQDPGFIKIAAPLLCRSKPVIDFFLSELVCPRAMKEFPSKLSSSGWDLATLKHRPTTGFSGTNDSRFLLPSMIAQHDIPVLRSTSANVLRKILQPENNFAILPQPTKGFSSDGAQLLDAVASLDPPIRVILDVGAQVIDMTNYEICCSWLNKWVTQKIRCDAQRRIYNQEDGSIFTRAHAMKLLEGDAQTIEERYGTALAEPNGDYLSTHQSVDDALQAKEQEFAISLRQSSTYAEEQERELSPEIEQEREVERPNPEKPHVHVMHADVLALVRSGTFNKASAAFVPAFEVFQQTTARALCKTDEFSERIWVTQDFVDTIEPSVPCNLDLFLKQVHWILRFREGEKIGCVVLSPYEANEAMPNVLRYGATELVVYSPRVSRTPRPFDEFSFGYVDHASLPMNKRLDIFLGLFAGQLYLKDYQQYKDLC
ncbi:MAG: hypothetical protein Q9162_007441 [Coniocarpon cinnabarinum]